MDEQVIETLDNLIGVANNKLYNLRLQNEAHLITPEVYELQFQVISARLKHLQGQRSEILSNPRVYLRIYTEETTELEKDGNR